MARETNHGDGLPDDFIVPPPFSLFTAQVVNVRDRMAGDLLQGVAQRLRRWASRKAGVIKIVLEYNGRNYSTNVMLADFYLHQLEDIRSEVAGILATISEFESEIYASTPKYADRSSFERQGLHTVFQISDSECGERAA